MIKATSFACPIQHPHAYPIRDVLQLELACLLRGARLHIEVISRDTSDEG